MPQIASDATSLPPRRPADLACMTGAERLEKLRAIRGMWRGKARDILKQVDQGREKRDLSVQEK